MSHLLVFLCFRFKSSTSGLLLATDVAARGLDIPAVEHVIHYQVPKDPDVSPILLVGVGWSIATILGGDYLVNPFGPELIAFISESFWLAFRKYTQMNKELQFAETEEW